MCVKIEFQMLDLHKEMEKYQSFEDTPPHALKKVEDLVDVFVSESMAVKDAVENSFSDYMIDELLRHTTSIPNAISALLAVARLIEYQCSIGGKRLIDFLNRTVKAGDKLFELCQRIYERHLLFLLVLH